VWGSVYLSRGLGGAIIPTSYPIGKCRRSHCLCFVADTKTIQDKNEMGMKLLVAIALNNKLLEPTPRASLSASCYTPVSKIA
jgi:hypothetical protein